MIEDPQGRGAFFRSLHDPVDTASPQRLFTLQALDAAARGKRAGNPGLRAAAPGRLVAVVAGIVRSDPAATLRQIAARLGAMREPTPRSGTNWKHGSVAHVLARKVELLVREAL